MLCDPRQIVHWEAFSQVADAGAAGPGWHPDPLDPTRMRWWDGTAWSARVARLEAGTDAISWHAGIAGLAAPDRLGPVPVVPVASEVRAPVESVGTTTSPVRLLVADEPDDVDEGEGLELELDASDEGTRAQVRRNRRSWALLAAAILILAAGAGAGTAMLGGDERPTVEQTLTYRDDDADFALRYPTAWSIDERTPGEGVIFAVGEKDALPLDKNTVSVVAGTSTDQPFVPLHALVSQTADELIAKLPNFRLVSATEARLADAPAFRLEFVDSTTKPAKRLVQVVGRTTSGRPLAVTLTVREPRTEPTEAELEEFLASVTSS